ncbi:MAG TPA: hypothetical protein VHP34_10020 [Alphaproteobacteria bacterium]|nr:hypothetical protein [Alphaproteobacteria bacterium]
MTDFNYFSLNSITPRTSVFTYLSNNDKIFESRMSDKGVSMKAGKTDSIRLRDIFKAAAIPLLAASVIIGGNVTYNVVTRQEMQVTVSQVESRLMRKNEGFGFTKSVYQTEQGPLTNTLSPLNSKFSRGPIEEQIKEGGTYNVTTVGVSIPALRIYPNIISATQVKPPGR